MSLPRRPIRPLLRLRLLASAWRLHAAAQTLVHGQTLAATREAMLERAPGLPGTEPADAAWAARWAGRAGRRLLGRLDTCLVRSLVAGALLAHRPDVEVRLGVRRPRPAGDPLDAHAWLTVSGLEVVDGDGKGGFEEVMVLHMERG